MYVLLVIIKFTTSGPYTSYAVTTAEFMTRERCEIAAAFYRDAAPPSGYSRPVVSVACAAK